MFSDALIGIGLAVIFGGLSGLHLFWAFGGRWGNGAAIAEIAGRPRFTPTRGATLAVATALAAAAVVVLTRAGLILCVVPTWASHGSAALLGTVLVLRSIGDFRLIGFFKRVKTTRFATWDTWLYSPLCLLLGLGAWWLALR